MYAQPSSSPSEKDSVIRSPPTIRPVAHKAISFDVFADATYFKEQQAKVATAATPRAAAEGVVERPQTAEESEEPFER